MVFVVVNSVPSVGVQVMISNGKIGKQPTADVATLPTSQIASSSGNSSSNSDSSGNNVAQGEHKSDADGMRDSMSSFAAALVAGLISLTVLSSLV